MARFIKADEVEEIIDTMMMTGPLLEREVQELISKYGEDIVTEALSRSKSPIIV